MSVCVVIRAFFYVCAPQVYAAGCNIVILARNLERVQIIPGVCHGNVQVSCIDCSTDIGKVRVLGTHARPVSARFAHSP